MRNRGDGFLYVLKETGVKCVKIGVSSQPFWRAKRALHETKRFGHIVNIYHFKSMEDARAAEKQVKAALGHRSAGKEWFRVCASDMTHAVNIIGGYDYFI